jgi:hypothetical protein
VNLQAGRLPISSAFDRRDSLILSFDLVFQCKAEVIGHRTGPVATNGDLMYGFEIDALESVIDGYLGRFQISTILS